MASLSRAYSRRCESQIARLSVIGPRHIVDENCSLWLSPSDTVIESERVREAVAHLPPQTVRQKAKGPDNAGP
jgi:hypothetical protein